MWYPPVAENMLRGYRPFHALDCWARIMKRVDGNCICGGLDRPLYRLGDG